MIILLDCSKFNVKPHIYRLCVHVSDITKNKLSRTQQFISRILWQDCYGLCPSSLSSRHSVIISTSKIGVPNERFPKLWWHALLSNWNQWVSNQNTQELMPRLKKTSFVLYHLPQRIFIKCIKVGNACQSQFMKWGSVVDLIISLSSQRSLGANCS